MLTTTQDTHRQDEDTPAPPILAGDVRHSPIERHGYQPSKSSRVFGSIGSIAICSLIAAGLLETLERFDPPPIQAPALVVSLLPEPTVPHPVPKKIETPKPPQKKLTAIQPRVIDPTPPPPNVLAPSPVPPVASAPHMPVDPAPRKTQAAPPPSPPSPVAPPVQSSHGPDKWEGRVLARVNRVLRYPEDARRARQQGTAYVRFRIDRDGHVLSASLDQTSGYPALDQAALDTVRRADPLPKIPADRPDQVELLVPVQFSIQR